jgi:hypothetical protein
MFFWKQMLQGLSNQTQFSYMLNLTHVKDGLSTIRNQNNCPILFYFILFRHCLKPMPKQPRVNIKGILPQSIMK